MTACLDQLGTIDLMPEDNEEYISTSQAQIKYNVSRMTLLDLVKAGKLPVYRSKGNKNYYKISELEEVIPTLNKFRRVLPPEN
jgi:DNA-binding transcriptional regulator PaaX